MSFKLNSTLEQDSIFISELGMSQLRLINNANFPWVIIVPKLPDIVEITDLSDAEYDELCKEIMVVSEIMQKSFTPDKLNIATIGNVVSQMHVHIIARYKTDKLFPKPVWGDEFAPYRLEESKKIIDLVKDNLPK